MKAMSPAHDQRESDLALPADLVAVFLILAGLFTMAESLISPRGTRTFGTSNRWILFGADVTDL